MNTDDSITLTVFQDISSITMLVPLVLLAGSRHLQLILYPLVLRHVVTELSLVLLLASPLTLWQQDGMSKFILASTILTCLSSFHSYVNFVLKGGVCVYSPVVVKPATSCTNLGAVTCTAGSPETDTSW